MAIAGRLSFFNLPELFSSTTRAKLGSFCLIATLVFSFWSTIQGWFQTYCLNDFNYQGFLVLPLISVLVLKKNSALKRAAVNSSPFGLILLFSTSLLWSFAIITDLKLFADFCLISMLLAATLSMCGKKVSRLLLPPLLCLYFLLPVGQELFLSIQQVLGASLVHTLTMFDSAVYWQDANIIFAKHVFALDNLLRGLHFLLLYMLLGLWIAAIYSKKTWRQLLMSGMFAVLPVLTLSFSTLALIMLSKWVAIAKLSLNSQIIFSWFFTVGGLIAALSLSMRLRGKHTSDDIDWHNSLRPNSNWFFTTLLAASLITITPFAGNALKNHHHFNTVTSLSTPDIVRNWSGPEIMPQVQANTKQVTYMQNTAQVKLSFTKILQTQDWSIRFKAPQVKQNILQISVNDQQIPVTESIIKNRNSNQIVWNVFQVNQHLVNNPIWVQLLVSLYSLTDSGAQVELITLSTDVTGDINASRSRLQAFMQDLSDTHNTNWL